MKLFESVNGLLAGTRYLAWGIAVLGILGSVILFIANIPFGIGAVCLVASVVIMGIVYAVNGGFPAVHLIFA